MAPVTIASGDKNAYYSAGNIGWSARSTFADRVMTYVPFTGDVTTFGDVDASAAIAQSFTPTSADALTTVRLWLTKNGTPTDNLSLELRSDSGSNTPSGTVLATATNTIGGASLFAATRLLGDFLFTPYTLTSGTKYWIVLQRSGALDATNYYRVHTHTGSAYAGGGRSLYTASTTTWGAESATHDLGMLIFQEAPNALYHVTQDTSLHVWRSTDDGATWSEQDSANAPTVTNANYPFDVEDIEYNRMIATARFTATNTAAVRLFNFDTNTWQTSDYGTTPPSTVSNERPIRVSVNHASTDTSALFNIYLHYTDSADDADLAYQRATSPASAWAAKVSVLAVTSTEASTYSAVPTDRGTTGYHHRFYYDVANDDYFVRSLSNISQSTAVALNTSAADVETEHAVAVYQVYRDGSNVDTVIAAYINASGQLVERIATLGGPVVAGDLATEATISTSTSYAGRQIGTCQYDGTNYVVACTGTGIDYYTSTVAGTWSSVTNWKTGLTNAALSQVLAINGHGLLAVYTDNGNAVFDWIVAPSASVGSTGTVGAVAITGTVGTSTGIHNVTSTGTAGTVTVTGLTGTSTGGASVDGDSTGAVGAVAVTGTVGTSTGAHNVTSTGTAGTVIITGLTGTTTTIQSPTSTSTVGAVTVTGLLGASTGQQQPTSTSTVGTVTVAGLTGTSDGQQHQTSTGTAGSVTVTGLAGTSTATQSPTSTGTAGAITVTGLTGTSTGQQHGASTGAVGTVTVTGLTATSVGLTGALPIGIFGVHTFGAAVFGQQQHAPSDATAGSVTIIGLTGTSTGIENGASVGIVGIVTVSGLAGSTGVAGDSAGAIGSVIIIGLEGQSFVQMVVVPFAGSAVTGVSLGGPRGSSVAIGGAHGHRQSGNGRARGSSRSEQTVSGRTVEPVGGPRRRGE